MFLIDFNKFVSMLYIFSCSFIPQQMYHTCQLHCHLYVIECIQYCLLISSNQRFDTVFLSLPKVSKTHNFQPKSLFLPNLLLCNNHKPHYNMSRIHQNSINVSITCKKQNKFILNRLITVEVQKRANKKGHACMQLLFTLTK